VKYNSIREKIKSGDLVALSHYVWASWYDLQVQAVRVFTQSEYAHVASTLVWGGRVWVVEAVSPLVRLVPLSLYVDKGFYHISLPEATDLEVQFALAHVGKGQYSKVQGVLAQLNKLKIGEDALWECAEFTIACRRLSGVDLGGKATPSAVVQAALRDSTLQYVQGP
jgi:hypothetical protein